MKRWPQHKAYFWEYAPFFRALVPLAAGIYYYDAHLLSEQSLPLCVLFVAIGLGLAGTVIAKGRKWQQVLYFVLMQIVLFIAGYALTYATDARNDRSFFGQEPADGSLLRINKPPQEKEYVWKIDGEVIRNIRAEGVLPGSGRVLLYLYKGDLPMLYKQGDTLIVPAKWQPIANAGNPHEFDYANYCRRNNIYGQQFCTSAACRLYAADDPEKVPFSDGIHRWCNAQLDRYLPDTLARGLVQAMLLGDEANLDPDLRQSFSETGIVHVIAISGGNVLLFFSFISLLLFWLRHERYKWVKYLLALPLVWFYVLMAGSSPSAIRAAFMFSLVAFGQTFQKGNNGLNQLFAASFLLLVAQPMWLFSIGFQLSFAAVLSLILFYEPIRNLLRPKGWLMNKLWDATAASLAAELLVAPLVIYYFHQFPLLFLVANILALAFMEVVLFVGIAIIIFSPFLFVSDWLGCAAACLVHAFDRVILVLQIANPISFRFLQISLPEMLLVYAVIGCSGYFMLRQKKVALFSALLAGVVLLVLLNLDQYRALRQDRLIVYNAGKAIHAERIIGNHFNVICTDTESTKAIDYATRPAHIALNAWRRSKFDSTKVFTVNRRKVLVLTDSLNQPDSFPIDYLVVTKPIGYTPEQAIKAFRPSTVVIGNNCTKQDELRWLTACSKHATHLHITRRDGAFQLGGSSL